MYITEQTKRAQNEEWVAVPFGGINDTWIEILTSSGRESVLRLHSEKESLAKLLVDEHNAVCKLRRIANAN